MSQIEEQRQQKQELLQTEILDKGYDPLAFQIFLEQVKKDGSDDIDAWTLEELQTCIESFRIKEEAQKQQRQSVIYKSVLLSQSVIKQQLPEEELKQQVQEPVLLQQSEIVPKESQIAKSANDTNFKYEMDCRKPERNKLTDFILEQPNKIIEITMNEYMTKSEGLFSTGYGAFKIQTQPLGWTVWRRFSDFAWLRQIFQKAFPFQLIPPIPNKKIKVHATESCYLEKRMKVLELFLQNCLQHPQCRTHQALVDFLSISDEVQFKDRQLQYDRAAAPQRPSEYVTPTGKCTLEISPEIKVYSQSLNDYLKNSGDMYSKLGENFKKLFLDLDVLSGTLQNIGEQFDSLSKVTELFCRTNAQQYFISEVEKIQLVYQELSKFMQGWYANVIFQMKNVKENFYEFFMYHRKVQEQALEFLNQRNQLQQKFNEARTKLTDKKEKLFVLPDVNKWDLPPDIPKPIKELQFNKAEAFRYMLPSETKQLNDLKENFAYLNRQTVDEMNFLMEFRNEVYSKKFIRVAQMRSLDIAKLHHVIADFLNNISEIQGQYSGSLSKRSVSMYIDKKYDKFFGMKPQLNT